MSFVPPPSLPLPFSPLSSFHLPFFLIEYLLASSGLFFPPPLFSHQFAVSGKVMWRPQRFSTFTVFLNAFLRDFCVCAHTLMFVCVCLCLCVRAPSGPGRTRLWIQSQQIRMWWRGKLLFSPSFNSSLLVSLASFNPLHFLNLPVCACVTYTGSCRAEFLFPVTAPSAITSYWSVIDKKSPIGLLMGHV